MYIKKLAKKVSRMIKKEMEEFDKVLATLSSSSIDTWNDFYIEDECDSYIKVPLKLPKEGKELMEKKLKTMKFVIKHKYGYKNVDIKIVETKLKHFVRINVYLHF